MKTSAGLFLTDILPHKRKLYNKLIKNRILSGVSQAEAFSKLKKSGVDGVELFLPSYYDTKYKDINEVKKVLDTYKMPVFSLHQAIRFFTKTKLAEITTLFHMADMVGAKVIVLHMNTVGRAIFDKEFVQTLHSLQNKYNIKIGFENKERFLKTERNKHLWHEDIFSSFITDCGFHMTFDTTHLAQAGGDIISFFKKNKKYIINIHLSDFKNHKVNSFPVYMYKHMALGKGTLPIKEFLKTLQKEHYNGLVTMEMNTDLTGICESAKIIKSSAK